MILYAFERREDFPISLLDFDVAPPLSDEPVIDPATACADALRRQAGLLALAMICSMFLLVFIRLVYMRLGIHEGALASLPTYLFAFLLPFAIFGHACGHRGFFALPYRRPDTSVLAATGGMMLALSVVGVLLSVLLGRLFAKIGLYTSAREVAPPSGMLEAVLLFGSLTVLPAIFEEVALRGFVLGTLRQFGDRFAILISALLFALLHRSLVQFPNAFLLGLLLGYYLIKTESLLGCILLHFCNNLLVVLLGITTSRMLPGEALLTEGVVFLCYLSLGAIGLIYLGLVRRVDFSLPHRCLPLTTGQLYRIFFCHFPVLTMLLGYGWMIYLGFRRVAG